MKVRVGPFLVELTRKEADDTIMFYNVSNDINLGVETANNDETHALTLRTLGKENNEIPNPDTDSS